MDNGIWAVWYNLADAKRKAHLDWLHGTYLPDMVSRPGIAWAAHYRIDEEDYKDRRDKLTHTTDAIPQGTQYICLVAAASPHLFFRPESPLFEENHTADTRKRLAEREEMRFAVFCEEERTSGPSYGHATPGGVPAAAIQMGSFNMTSVETEVEIGKWYAQLRMPDMAKTQGSIRTRKLLSLVGWGKHSVLYEFTSHEDRRKYAIHPHSPFSQATVDETVHAPGSPSIGHRTWPPAG